MKSIEKRFNRLKRENPRWSTLVCFNETVYKQKFAERIIKKWFSKLVDRDDFLPSHKESILFQAVVSSN